MISDIFLLFSDALSGTTSAATTDYLDNKAGKGNMNDPGAKIAITIDTAFTAVSGAPTNTFQLQTADDSDFISCQKHVDLVMSMEDWRDDTTKNLHKLLSLKG